MVSQSQSIARGPDEDRKGFLQLLSGGVFVWARRHWLLVALGALGVILVGLVVGWMYGKSASTELVTAPVIRGTITRSVTETGSVNPILTIIVGTYVSGVIQDIYCDFNTRVKKGQLCAKIDPRPYQTIVDQERANLATAKAQRVKDEANAAYTKTEKERYINLFAKKAISQDARDIAINNAAQAAAQVALDAASVAQHQAALAAAEVNLGYTDITSPVDGVVVSRNVTIGQTVAASFQTPTLFLIATDLAKMQVDTNVSESDIGDVKDGDAAYFSVDAFPDRTFKGVVTQVRQSPQTIQNVVTYDVVVTVANPQFLLKPGMTATVRIVTQERKNVLRVPNQALRYTPGGLHVSAEQPAASTVWVERRGERVALPVTTGLSDDTNTEIVNGDLKPGDVVIVSEKRAASSAPSTAFTPRL
jgi:HlyD family secretion protein